MGLAPVRVIAALVRGLILRTWNAYYQTRTMRIRWQWPPRRLPHGARRAFAGPQIMMRQCRGRAQVCFPAGATVGWRSSSFIRAARSGRRKSPCLVGRQGEVEPDEDLLDAAHREFCEETGLTLAKPVIPLAPIRQASGKVVHVWGSKRTSTLPLSGATRSSWSGHRAGAYCSFRKLTAPPGSTSPTR